MQELCKETLQYKASPGEFSALFPPMTVRKRFALTSSACTSLRDCSAFAVPAMSCFGDPPYTKICSCFVSPVAFGDFAPGVAGQLPIRELINLSILYLFCFSVLYPFVSYLSCSFCNSSVYLKVCLSSAVKGEGMEKGRGIPLPFSVFLVPFVTVQKERLFFSLRKRHSLSFLLVEEQSLSCLP